MVLYPILIAEMAKREIPKKVVAQSIGVCEKAFSNKLSGKTQFTWGEIKKIHQQFFPRFSIEELFSTADEADSA